MRNGGFCNAEDAWLRVVAGRALILTVMAYSSSPCDPKTSQNLPLLR
jgi:hypothetical protein